MPIKYKAIIVDDEELARKDLRNVLTKFDTIKIVGEASNLEQAEELLKSQKPDIVFLDIQFPGESGFNLLEKISPSINVIFITAYDKHAVRAFEVNALDYLLKPVNPDRLKVSLERIEDSKIENHQTDKLDYEDSIFISFKNKYTFMKVSSIAAITSAGDYTEITTTTKDKGLTTKTMKEWESRLPERRFIRIHRSVIVNSDYIEKMEEWFNYSYRVFIKGIEKPFIMSKRYALKHKSKLG